MTLADLGKKLKQKYSEYAHMADYEAGELLVRKYPEYKKLLNPSLQQVHEHTAKKVPLFANRAIERMEQEAKYNQAIVNHYQATEKAQRTAHEEMRTLDRTSEGLESSHTNQTTLLNLATKSGVDVPTHKQGHPSQL